MACGSTQGGRSRPLISRRLARRGRGRLIASFRGCDGPLGTAASRGHFNKPYGGFMKSSLLRGALAMAIFGLASTTALADPGNGNGNGPVKKSTVVNPHDPRYGGHDYRHGAIP